MSLAQVPGGLPGFLIAVFKVPSTSRSFVEYFLPVRTCLSSSSQFWWNPAYQFLHVGATSKISALGSQFQRLSPTFLRKDLTFLYFTCKSNIQFDLILAWDGRAQSKFMLMLRDVQLRQHHGIALAPLSGTRWAHLWGAVSGSPFCSIDFCVYPCANTTPGRDLSAVLLPSLYRQSYNW